MNNFLKLMTEDGTFIDNYADASEMFTNIIPDTVFPPPIKDVMAYHMERW